MGGAGKSGQWYDWLLDTKWRDWGCSAIVVLACWLAFGWHGWVYLAVFVLHWGAFSTYWDWLFKGKDTFWFSGLMVGLALTPILWINVDLWPIVALRTGFLAVSWEALNRYLPQKVWIWRRDVVEEFSRYAVSL
jgi:hypothetical protein